MTNQSNISSDYLFHYKKDLNVLNSIIKDGFRHTSWPEELPSHGIQHKNFISCFCDILPDQAGKHQEIYGQNAIVMTKEWGIVNRLTPVTYIHENSVPVDEEYMLAKNISRTAQQFSQEDGSSYADHYGALYYSNEQNPFDVNQPIEKQTQDLGRSLSQLEIEFCNQQDAIDQALRCQGLLKEHEKHLRILFNSIVTLHNNIEFRDATVRLYEGLFEYGDYSNKNHRFYDEREWRSVKYSTDIIKEGDYRYLAPDMHNLKFLSGDVVHIIAPKMDHSKILDHSKKNTCLLSVSEIETKLITFEEVIVL